MRKSTTTSCILLPPTGKKLKRVPKNKNAYIISANPVAPENLAKLANLQTR
jgi:hypothetical protein